MFIRKVLKSRSKSRYKNEGKAAPLSIASFEELEKTFLKRIRSPMRCSLHATGACAHLPAVVYRRNSCSSKISPWKKTKRHTSLPSSSRTCDEEFSVYPISNDEGHSRPKLMKRKRHHKEGKSSKQRIQTESSACSSATSKGRQTISPKTSYLESIIKKLEKRSRDKKPPSASCDNLCASDCLLLADRKLPPRNTLTPHVLSPNNVTVSTNSSPIYANRAPQVSTGVDPCESLQHMSRCGSYLNRQNNSCPNSPRPSLIFLKSNRSRSSERSEVKEANKPTSMASMVKDFMSKITSYAKGTESHTEECEANSGKRSMFSKVVRRCVHFQPSGSKDMEELYFNQDLNRADASVECDICASEGIAKNIMPCLMSCDTQTIPELSKNKVDKGSPSLANVFPLLAVGVPPKSLGETAVIASLGTRFGDRSVAENFESNILEDKCGSAQAQYYHNKLLSTLQILQNKEETIRVQARSLALAEQRAAALSARLASVAPPAPPAPPAPGDNTCPLNELKRPRSSHSNDSKSVASTQTLTAFNPKVNYMEYMAQSSDRLRPDDQEVENQKKMVKTLQDHLSVIEELYRERFYESAKQEETIESLRQACRDARDRERERGGEGGLRQLLHQHEWRLARCQGIAAEVENLKMEISNFLNGSNNDSGVWEESLPEGVGEELRDVTGLLLQLRDILLQEECYCNLQDENQRLQQKALTLEGKVEHYKAQVYKLRAALGQKENCCQKKSDTSDHQLQALVRQYEELQKVNEEQLCSIRCLTEELRQTKELLEEKDKLLSESVQRAGQAEGRAAALEQDLEKADQIIKNNCVVRSEVSYLSEQVSLWRRQLSAAEARARQQDAELLRARTHCRHLDHCCQQKVATAAMLEQQLSEAQARGAALCGEARRVVSDVRRWVQQMRNTQREQLEKIQAQDSLIEDLRNVLCGMPPYGSPRKSPCGSRDKSSSSSHDKSCGSHDKTLCGSHDRSAFVSIRSPSSTPQKSPSRSLNDPLCLKLSSRFEDCNTSTCSLVIPKSDAFPKMKPDKTSSKRSLKNLLKKKTSKAKSDLDSPVHTKCDVSTADDDDLEAKIDGLIKSTPTLFSEDSKCCKYVKNHTKCTCLKSKILAKKSRSKTKLPWKKSQAEKFFISPVLVERGREVGVQEPTRAEASVSPLPSRVFRPPRPHPHPHPRPHPHSPRASHSPTIVNYVTIQQRQRSPTPIEELFVPLGRQHTELESLGATELPHPDSGRSAPLARGGR